MVYSVATSHVEKTHVVSAYAYDALGRRNLTQSVTGEVLRTLYDGGSFEVIREGESFRDGSLTTRFAPGEASANAFSNQATGERYRWVGDGGDSARTRAMAEDGYTVTGSRYGARGVTLYGKGEAVAVGSSTGSRAMYLGKDVMGSTRSVTVETGTIEDRYEYDAFGQPYKGDLGGGINLGYTGKPYDTATGLYNYGYRDYRPQAARFTTVDPIRDGSNWFAYVNNDPVNWVDLWGESPVGIGAAVGALVGGVSGAVNATRQGGSFQNIVASAVGGAIGGAITGAAIGTGNVATAVVGGGVGGIIGSITTQVISNGGINGLNAQTVIANAAIAGVVSVATTAATVVIGVGGNVLVNNAWEAAAALTNTMDGSWGVAVSTALNTKGTVATVTAVSGVVAGVVTELVTSAATNSVNKKSN